MHDCVTTACSLSGVQLAASRRLHVFTQPITQIAAAGVLWKHVEYRNGHAETRRARTLVLQSSYTIVNYGAPLSTIKQLVVNRACLLHGQGVSASGGLRCC